MVSFNILGVCTSRDIFSRTTNDYVVNRYTLGFSPLFCLDNGLNIDFEIYNKILTINNITYSNFMKRAFFLELNRSVFDFIIEKKSDFLLLDTSLLKYSYFKTADGKFFVNGIKGQRHTIYKLLARELNLPPIVDYNIPCNYFDKGETISRLKLYANKILTLYPPKKIVLCEHLNSRLMRNSQNLTFFDNFDKTFSEENSCIDFAFNFLKGELEGCHVINSLNNAISDVKHPLGKSPLHFTKGYYNYFLESIKTILKGLPIEDEILKLDQIRRKWDNLYAVSNFSILRNYAVDLSNRLSHK